MNDLNVLEALQATSIQSKRYLNSKCANALKGAVSGGAISLDDISLVDHKIVVGVRSKNLIPYPYPVSSQTINGVTFTINEDGSITANGTASGGDAFFNFIPWKPSQLAMKKGIYYTLSGCPKGGSLGTYRLTYSSDPGGQDMHDLGDGVTHLCTEDAEAYSIYVGIRSGATVNNLVFKPQFEKGTAKTEYTPCISDDEDIILNVGGKNLLPVNKVQAGIDNNKVLFSGALTGDFVFSHKLNLEAKNNATIFQYTVDGVTYNTTKWSTTQSFSGTLTKIIFLNWIGATEGSIDDIQLEVGTAKTEFEPYQESFVVTTSTNETIELSSFSPNMSIIPARRGVLIEAEYNKDPNKVIDALVKAIISLGGTI